MNGTLGKLEGQKISLVQSIYPQEMHAFAIIQPNSVLKISMQSLFIAPPTCRQLIKTLKYSDAKKRSPRWARANLTASICSLLGFEAGLLRQAGGLDNALVTILETEDCEHFTLKRWNAHLTWIKETKIS